MTTFEGSLSKWTNLMKGWQYRWFVVDAESGLLSYYTSREKMKRGARRGCVRLRGAVIGIDDEDNNTFTITVDSKTFHFQARDAAERRKWVRCLEDVICKCGRSRFKSQESPGLFTVKTNATLEDFDRKLTEADAYLQIIIDQMNSLDARIKVLHESDEKLKCERVLSTTNEMLEEVKHTIVLLQIAKNTSHSDLPSSSDDSASDAKSSGQVSASAAETSSSSSSEENFFDARDNDSNRDAETSDDNGGSSEINASCSEQSRVINDSEESEDLSSDGSSKQHADIPSNSNFVKPNGFLDYDAMYDDTTESDVSLRSQGSIISHLLAQVKIGMDLTKVVLPTFILERRSLLEMYADYFAHPDMFVEIADKGSERDRMIQVVKWYLSSYHAGRKSGVAKKPYNPVLGEVFKCHWDLDRSEDEFVLDGPLEKCRRNQLTFIAEQVSHHPPISAFYAEHYNKRISFNAHVWTKSKFLGLSIGVHNVGFGTVSVIDRGEDYVLTFPNGYGRSILTQPWIELGGTVKVTCVKTGYNATIEFLTKPFYGGKKHRILGEIYQPNEKKPFLTITGEWNGVMDAKWSDGKTELFADVNDLSINKKIVGPVDQQCENESRRLWKKVTAGLKLDDVPYATKAKSEIEQKQRFEAQQRKQMGVPWTAQYFEAVDQDKWAFRKPLEKRLNLQL